MAKCGAGYYGLGLVCFAVAVAVAGATQFTVGGANGWCVPPAGAESLNAWAMKNRFQIGDKLVFVYPSDEDSVLLVQPADYNACNTSSYDKKFTDGDTVFTLDRSGAFFFTSGVDANCRANEKLIVMVLAAGHNGTGGASSAPPAVVTPPPPAPPSNTAPPPSPPSTSPPPVTTPSPPPPPPAASSPAPTSPTTASPPPPPAPAPTTPTTSTPPPATPPSTPASSPAPGTHAGNNGTTITGTTSPPSAGRSNNHRNDSAGPKVSAGLAGSVGACIVVGFAMLAL